MLSKDEIFAIFDVWLIIFDLIFIWDNLNNYILEIVFI